MKCLKIEADKGCYSLDGTSWTTIDKINKDDLLKLLDVFLVTDFEMDEPLPGILNNQSHYIIYSNIYTKFKDLERNKTRFRDESERVYKEALEKYRQANISQVKMDS